MPPREHHFFLFRHCIRSTSVGSEGDYFSAAGPDWGVPEDWCTERGADLVKSFGRSLWGDGVFGGGTVQVELIADESQRDIDTVYNLALGIEGAAADGGHKHSTVGGIHSLAFDPWLFDPEEICPTTYSYVDMKTARENRFEEVDMPEQPPALILDRLEAVMGEGKWSLSSIAQDVGLADNKASFSGAGDLLSHVGEVLFFSRASNIPYAPQVTNDEVYELLQWNQYERSVLYVGNPRAAYHGAVVANAMIGVLRDGYFQKQEQHEETSYDSRVTILAGHDTDLDGIATALGARWQLKPPYVSDQNGSSGYVQTPPMSALHARRNIDTGHVSLSFLYPVFSEDWSGEVRYDSVPLVFENDAIGPTQGDLATTLEYTDAADRLERHIETTLAGYRGANACYAKADAVRAVLQTSHGMIPMNNTAINTSFADISGRRGPVSAPAFVGFFLGAAIVAAIGSAATVFLLKRQRERFEAQRSTDNAVTPDEDMEVRINII